jgi:hypothetical protein
VPEDKISERGERIQVDPLALLSQLLPGGDHAVYDHMYIEPAISYITGLTKERAAELLKKKEFIARFKAHTRSEASATRPRHSGRSHGHRETGVATL